ncbi:unnamed protein product [Ilex paraguariensis]|uniref:Uncharacterized protein n=1 Tax=Ilex paraguariensis TaxID=185542 RepID=A0ABC8SZD1_9AQUA
MRLRAHHTSLEISRTTMIERWVLIPICLGRGVNYTRRTSTNSTHITKRLRGAVKVEVWDAAEEEDEIEETTCVVEAIRKSVPLTKF